MSKDPESTRHPLTEQDLVDLLRSRSWSTSRPADRCLSEVEVAGFVAGGPGGRSRKRIEGHLAACNRCLGMAATLLRLEDQPVPLVPPDLRRQALDLVATRRRARPRLPLQWRVALPAAASLILVVGMFLWRQDTARVDRPSAEAASAQEVGAVRRGVGAPDDLRILAPAEGAVVEPERVDLLWTAASQGLFYEVQVVSDEGDLVWQGRTEETRLRLPAESRLGSDREYFLWVRAYLPDGKTVRSPAVGFRVVPRE